MKYHVLTLFPDMIREGLSQSIIGRAEKQGLLTIHPVNIRDFARDRHSRVDGYSYGGGAGMVMEPGPVCDAWESVTAGRGKKPRVIYLTPQGRTFDQAMAEELAREEELIFLCGHYEGIDERALEAIVTDYVSMGDYVLTGGELPAMVMIDCISRLIPGVLHNEESAEVESFHDNLLEYPQYTRPEVFRGKQVPEVLLKGEHKKIEAWRRRQSIQRTMERRPDLMEAACLTEEERIYAEELRSFQEQAAASPYRVLSLDLFQTLADINARQPQIWQEILGEHYTEGRARAGAQFIVSAYKKNLRAMFRKKEFLPMREMYEACCRQALTGAGFSKYTEDPARMAEIILRNHGEAPIYQDVIPVLKAWKNSYTLILSSDASPSMARGVLKRLEADSITFDQVFLSDEMGCYKGEPGGRFFKTVTEALSVRPEEILHIGDSLSDIFGAGSAGVSPCLLNREYTPWKHSLRPALMTNSLEELERIMGSAVRGGKSAVQPNSQQPSPL